MNNPSGTPIILGIDVSKEWVDAHILPSGAKWRVPNDAKELKTWVEQLPKGITLTVIEATGGLESLAASAMALAKIPTAIVNPKQVRSFAEAMGQRAKTDPIDAMLIAQFGERIQPKAKTLPDKDHAELKELMARRRQLIKNKVAEQNRLGTMRSKQAQKSIKAHIRWLTKQIERINQQIDDTIKKSPMWLSKEQLLITIPGIGPTTARSSLVHIPELGQMNNKQVASLGGLAPFTRESGKWKGKRFIGGGRKEFRSTLYMATLSATQSNPVIAPFYLSLIKRGKPHKVAMTACMRKLLTIMNAMVRDQTPWSKC